MLLAEIHREVLPAWFNDVSIFMFTFQSIDIYTFIHICTFTEN